jgi:hypothetical protein
MSRVESHSGEPVEATPRLSMTPARRRRVLARQGDRCAAKGCNEPWTEIDHIIALGLGGPETDDAIEGLCKAHHAEKTRRDNWSIKKAARLRRDASPETRRKSPRPLRSRGFQKDPLR